MPTFYCNYFFLFGTRGPLTLGGPLDFAYPAYSIVTPLLRRLQQSGLNYVGPTVQRIACKYRCEIAGRYNSPNLV